MQNRTDLDVATELTIAAINNRAQGIIVGSEGGKRVAALFNAILDGVVEGVKKHTESTVE